MVRISSILEFGCSLIIGQSRGRTMNLDDGSPPPNPPSMTEEEKQEAAIYREEASCLKISHFLFCGPMRSRTINILVEVTCRPSILHGT